MTCYKEKTHSQNQLLKCVASWQGRKIDMAIWTWGLLRLMTALHLQLQLVNEERAVRKWRSHVLSAEDDYEGCDFLVKDALYSIQDKLAKPRVGYCCAASQLWTCSLTLLNNIWDEKWALTLHCNAGMAIVTQKEDLKVYRAIWYHTDFIANILLLNNVQKKHKVTYNSSQKTKFIVHKVDGTTLLWC